jgi:hypothetical protein
LPPANTPSDGSELVGIPFRCQQAFHNYNRIANWGINVELSPVPVKDCFGNGFAC